ncbi:hypothetical protein COT63_00220 [Candidatus Shapirobacteria bacterium CG09_land_8_20_14_0_10_38_17]|uniref:Uncharacterized protein n=1 Tax=Candidatus Shapirobacteria bacterium CG09_land_8_20_14_0_10_38_17 TaxID=1974884 RepID=A0A2H0WRV6_9BACT|nr:MAG: hypothetical protein COT63_00220 [Candidatus Shapirobacteria bacterium CG09_land_8_20_14_0_10_38_17]
MKISFGKYSQYQIYLPYLVTALIVLFTFSLFTAQIKKIISLWQSNKIQEEEIGKLKQRISQIESFSDDQIDKQISDALSALPRVKDPTLAFSATKALAFESGLLAEEIAFSPGKIAKEIEETASHLAKVEEMLITLQVQGSQENIIKIVRQINQSQPLMELKSIDLESFPDIAAKLSINIYFSPVAVGEVSAKADVLPTLEEENTYKKIADFRKLGSGVVIGESEFTPGDPTRDPFIYSQ